MTIPMLRNLVLIWLLWAVILVGYMHLIQQRYAPFRPDDALSWSATETTTRSNNNKPYLLEPFLNTQVAWDSEYYLSVSTVGYEDPLMRRIEGNGEAHSTSYAFFPLYPYLMKVVRLPFAAFMNPIAASTAAGLLIALVGTLFGMIALYDIVREELGELGGLRTVYMMLIFPTSLFFAVLYTEGLFIALAFGSLAFMRRKNLLAAAILAALATWTRAIGGVLIVPLALTWFLTYRHAKEPRSVLIQAPLVLLPLVAYGIWRYFYGYPFDFVEATWFGNGLFKLQTTYEAWTQILERARTVPETRFIVVLGISSVALALLSCLLTFRRYPQLALFGFLALLIPLTGGWTGTQSAIRYVLVVPSLWVMLGQWSRNPVFERSWTLLSILLLAMQAFLFSYDFWVA